MRCAHAGAVPVESVVTGEVLAALCPACDAQLPTEFLSCPHDNVIDTPALNQRPGLGICNGCGVSAWYGCEPINWADVMPQRVVSISADVTAEEAAAFKARFEAVQRGPHRLVFVPTVASISVPTPIEMTIP